MWHEFSDRIGATEPSDVIQIEHMSEALRNCLWNLLLRTVFSTSWSDLKRSVELIWEEFFKGRVDDLPRDELLFWDKERELAEFLRKEFFHPSFKWYHVYNMIQFIAVNASRIAGVEGQEFEEAVNAILEKERSGYRFIQGELTPISGEQETRSIETSIAVAQASGLLGARKHFQTAIKLLAKKPEADYRNSIKESISAIESVAKQMTGQDSFSQAIAELDAEIGFHGGFKTALRSLYGYTSDENGIRHAILEERDVGLDEAKFMLVICSALFNFVVSKSAKHGLLEAEE